jgi:hypothetical protein
VAVDGRAWLKVRKWLGNRESEDLEERGGEGKVLGSVNRVAVHSWLG